LSLRNLDTMIDSFTSTLHPPTPPDGPVYWLIFSGYRLLVVETDDDQARLPFVTGEAELGLSWQRSHYLGYVRGQAGETAVTHYYAADVATDTGPPEGMGFYGLRQLYGRLPEEQFSLAGRAVQIVDWDRTHQFCGRCATPMERQQHERAKKCPACGLTAYPRLSPAIIVAVVRRFNDGSRLLLARSHRHPSGMYSVLAGFVEPGESLETAVRREVKEEVGLDVTNIRYFGSQPWPFPNSLMLAFTAEYAGGDIRLEVEEIAEAGWYTADNLPLVPPPISIARRLIDWYVEGVKRKA
jgi:NAD+ diphosphatase